MKSVYAVVLLPLFCLIACTTASTVSSVPAPGPSPEAVPPTEPNHSIEMMSWRITPTSQPQAYSSLVTTVITQPDGSTTRRDSLNTQARYSMSTTRVLDTLFITGSLTGFTITGNTSEIERPDISLPVSFTAKLSPHTLLTQLSSNNQSDPVSCENPANTSLKTLQRNLFLLPLQLRTTQTWTDSISTTSCSGTIPVISTVVRTLTVAGLTELEGSSVILINENERTFSKGEGSQGQHRIMIEGEGSTSGKLYVDPGSGVLLALSSVNKTTLLIQSSGRVQRFLQNSTETIQRLH